MSEKVVRSSGSGGVGVKFETKSVSRGSHARTHASVKVAAWPEAMRSDTNELPAPKTDELVQRRQSLRQQACLGERDEANACSKVSNAPWWPFLPPHM